MAKKDIGKILTTGSAKQRLLLIVEETARGKYFLDRILTDSEFNQLSDSFRKPNEIKLWNEFRKVDESVTNGIVNLQGLLYEVKMHYSNLRGYILTWNAIENSEVLVNSVLHEIKDVKERRRIAKEGAKGVNLLFSKVLPDEEGYVEIDIDFEKEYAIWIDEETGEEIELTGKEKQPLSKTLKDEANSKIASTENKTLTKRKSKEYTLWGVMNSVRKETERAVIKYLSWEGAILDYMDEKGFNVKTYKDKIKELSSQIYSPIIGWGKYYGKDWTGSTHLRLPELLKKYSICPNIEELKIDEAQYSWYKKHFLEREDYPEELRGKVNKPKVDE